MFTGLIEAIGTITHCETTPQGMSAQVSIPADTPHWQLRTGDSIALDGACMTATTVTDNGYGFTFEASPESLSKTILGHYASGTRVNLERALPADGRLGGHFVTGHVDGTATLSSRLQRGNSTEWQFVVNQLEQLPPGYFNLLLPKGSITVSGVSLTINHVTDKGFSIALIPHTLRHTTFSQAKTGDVFNVEFDLLGKYVQSLLPPMQAIAPTANKPTAGKIHTGEWFCHDERFQGPPLH